jgi:hypothetical protein
MSALLPPRIPLRGEEIIRERDIKREDPLSLRSETLTILVIII